MSSLEPVAVPLPSQSRINGVYRRPDLADAYSIALPVGTIADAETLARFLFAQRPRWVAVLMGVRDALVGGFGLKTARALGSARERPHRIGIFRVYDVQPHEVIMGEDDRHLDFRASVLYVPADASSREARLLLSTVVSCHNAGGRAYLTTIAPFHRAVVQSFLRTAAKAGWPSDPAGANG